MDYFKIKAISNSDLEIARNIIKGKPQPKRPESAFSFGSALHEALLEPHLFVYENWEKKGIDMNLLAKLEKRCLANEMVKQFISGDHNEKIVTWTHPETQVLCKSKLDIIQDDTVIDLKTTSAKTQETFETDFVFYNYNRQCAFYMESIQAKKVIIVGISKTTDKIFFVSRSWTDNTIIGGRQEITRILFEIKERNLFEEIYNARNNT